MRLLTSSNRNHIELTMDCERFISEITLIRKKYSQAIFDLEKCKENVKSLEIKNESLAVDCVKFSTQVAKVQAEKEKIALDLESALEKIEHLSRKNPVGDEIQRKSSGEAQIPLLKKKIAVLEAQLKQTVLGTEQKRQSSNEDRHDAEEKEGKADETTGYEVEKILNHRQKGAKLEFRVRWKGFGAEGDTWEPESHLQCESCKVFNAYIKKKKI